MTRCVLFVCVTIKTIRATIENWEIARDTGESGLSRDLAAFVPIDYWLLFSDGA